VSVSFVLTNFFETRDLVSLGTLSPLDDVEFDLIAFFEALVALTLNGTVMNEDVGPTIPPEEAVTLCVVKPLYGALVLCQLRCSLSFVRVARMPRSESTSTVAGLKRM
jgi:hypothetical protein